MSELDCHWDNLAKDEVVTIRLTLPSGHSLSIDIDEDECPLQWKNAESSINISTGYTSTRVVSRVIGKKHDDGTKEYYVVDEETLEQEYVIE